MLTKLVLCPENLAWLLSGWGLQNMAGQKCGLNSICGQAPTELQPALRGITMATEGTFQFDKIILKVYLKARASKSNEQNGIRILIGMQETPKVCKIPK